MIPALLVLKKMPDRRGNRRIRIIKTILFWLLLQNFLNMGEKLGMLARIFKSQPSVKLSTTSTQNANLNAHKNDQIILTEYDFEEFGLFAANNTNKTASSRITRRSPIEFLQLNKPFSDNHKQTLQDKPVRNSDTSRPNVMQMITMLNNNVPQNSFSRRQTNLDQQKILGDLSSNSMANSGSTNTLKPISSNHKPNYMQQQQSQQVISAAPSSVYNQANGVDFAHLAAISVRDLDVDLSAVDVDDDVESDVDGDQMAISCSDQDQDNNDNQPDSNLGDRMIIRSNDNELQLQKEQSGIIPNQIVDIIGKKSGASEKMETDLALDKSHLRQRMRPNVDLQANASSSKYNINSNSNNNNHQQYLKFKSSSTTKPLLISQIKSNDINNNDIYDHDNADNVYYSPDEVNEWNQMRFRRQPSEIEPTNGTSINSTTEIASESASSNGNANANANTNTISEAEAKTLLDSNAMIMYLCWIVQVTKRIVSKMHLAML